jgi:hypothetical protein
MALDNAREAFALGFARDIHAVAHFEHVGLMTEPTS